MSLSGTAALVGAPWEDEACGGGFSCDAGAAYVFRSNATGWTWIEEAKLTAGDAEGNDEFGSSVSISGDVALIGAPFDKDAGKDTGAAYIFRYHAPTGEWHQEAKLTASDAAANDEFGYSVSVSGDVAVIGAPFDDVDGNSSGSIYVFRFDGFDWNEEAKFSASDASAFDNFGFSVSLDSERALVGALRGEVGVTNSGAAYVYEGLADCNENKVSDICDILSGFSEDCCPPHDCCEERPLPGCTDAAIQLCVCDQIPDCCLMAWTADCVAEVEAVCGGCDPGGNGIPDKCECPEDLDGDGEVRVPDLIILLGAWGPCPPSGGCPADLNGDCEVRTPDLIMLLGAWGQCPERGASGGQICLSLEQTLAIVGFSSVDEFIIWTRSASDGQVRVFTRLLLWVQLNWSC